MEGLTPPPARALSHRSPGPKADWETYIAASATRAEDLHHMQMYPTPYNNIQSAINRMTVNDVLLLLCVTSDSGKV